MSVSLTTRRPSPATRFFLGSRSILARSGRIGESATSSMKRPTLNPRFRSLPAQWPTHEQELYARDGGNPHPLPPSPVP